MFSFKIAIIFQHIIDNHTNTTETKQEQEWMWLSHEIINKVTSVLEE